MKRVGHVILLAMLALGTVGRAQEEDDDPKAKPPAATKARAAEKKAEARPKADPKSADADAKAKDAARKGVADKPAAGESKVEVKVEQIADEPAKKDKVKAQPKLARASETVIDVMAQPPESGAAPRSVRVRLVDGSTVVGSVRAEQVDALVVDCSLGQLSIPRVRISTIAYDAAAGVGAKRAPVQQLDDDAPTPKKRTVTP
jgi:hypothetical protein